MTDMLKKASVENVCTHSTKKVIKKQKRVLKLYFLFFNKSTVTVNTIAMLMLQQSQHPQALLRAPLLTTAFVTFSFHAFMFFAFLSFFLNILCKISIGHFLLTHTLANEVTRNYCCIMQFKRVDVEYSITEEKSKQDLCRFVRSKIAQGCIFKKAYTNA